MINAKERTFFQSALCSDSLQRFRSVFKAGRIITDDPQSLQEALDSPDAAKWRFAISSEYKSLARKKTWNLLSRGDVPKGQKVLRGKLVFKTKKDKNGQILKCKVRWVVRGFEQRYGKDYDQTYAGVCKSASWKLVLAL